MQFSVSNQIMEKSNILSLTRIRLSDKFKDAIKEEFKGMTCRLEIIMNEGGVQTGKIELKL